MSGRLSLSEFVERVQSARAAWDILIARIPRQEMVTPSFSESWSIKDIIAHITWHDREMAALLERRQFSGSPLWELPLAQRNQTIYEQNKDKSLDLVLEEAEQCFDRLMKLLVTLNDDELNDPIAFPGMPLEWMPWQVFASNTHEHYGDHAKQVRAWLGDGDAT